MRRGSKKKDALTLEEKGGMKKKESDPYVVWSKADRDKAFKAVNNVGVADLERLSTILGSKPIDTHVKPFVEGLLTRSDRLCRPEGAQ